MNRTQLAELLNVTTHTLKNWEKEKPELVRLINLGLKQIFKYQKQENYLRN